MGTLKARSPGQTATRPAHPRLFSNKSKAWMAGAKPGHDDFCGSRSPDAAQRVALAISAFTRVFDGYGGALQSRGPNRVRCLVRSRFSEAALRAASRPEKRRCLSVAREGAAKESF